MRNHVLLGVVIGLASLVLGTAQADSADLTGVWLGEQKCDRFDGEKFTTKFTNDIMLISQSGDQIRVAALLVDDNFQLLYQGTVIDDVKDPVHKGQASFTECTTAPGSPYQETGRATKVDVKTRGDGKFEATSVFFQTAIGESPADTGTCAWTYKRVDTADFGVPSCAEVATSTLKANGAQERRRR